MRTSLIPMRIHLRNALQREKDTIGYNLAALKYVSRRIQAESITHFSDIGEEHEKVITEGKKRKRVSIKT